MNKFVMPEMEIVSFDSNDVIATSGAIPCRGFCTEVCPNDCQVFCGGHCSVVTDY